MENYPKLIARLAEISHLNSAAAVLGWDQQCYMPPGGARERAEQFATLGKISHEMFVADETRALLEGAEAEAAGLAPESDERLTLRVVRRGFDQAAKLPTRLVQELAKAEAIGHEVWVEAREQSDFKKFASTLEQLLDLSRQKAECLGFPAGGTLYDALLDQFEPGMTTAEVERVFGELRPGLVELVQQIAAAPQIDDSVLKRDYPAENQKAFVDYLVAKLGFDFTRGRQDTAVHPFCTGFTRDDVRITTRYDKNWLPCAVMGSIHETGHALYEQGFDPKDDGTPLANAAGLGVHESQSRLWENIVGRSRAFWAVYLPELKKHFKGTLKDVDVETFYRAINRVEPSTIRVEADEVTYNLHIMLRFELEKELLSGKLAVKDVPEAWNQKMQEYLGIMPSDDKHGCLQDVHWSGGMFGYFPTYALGTLLSAQLYEKALKDEPGIEGELSKGEFGSLLNWLRENVHKPGARYLPSELVQRVCGEPAQSRSYLSYLRGKFGQLYGLN
jgi:carboxypeptidase Taq